MVVNEFFTFNPNCITRGHQLKLFVPDSRVNARANFFCVRVISTWNSLPENVVCASSLNLFCNLLNNMDFKHCIAGKI